jgi:hypothetical protein
MHRPAKVAIAALLGSMVIGCGQGAGDTTAFSDRQIFEGAVFGSGPVADLLPEARNNLRPELYVRNADELSALADARNATIKAIEQNHPGLMSEFARAARSGDPAKVQAMLARTTDAISEVSTDAATMRSPNVPIATRSPNVPIDSRSPNVPIATRSPNVPIDSLSPNVPIATRSPNVPIDSLSPNVPVQLALLTSRLFSEQLSSSVAMTFGPRADEH